MPSQRDDDQSGERLPRAGDRIAGKYIVDRVLKRGGMGVVLAARHAELSQPVAIKVLLPELASDASMVARFVREGRAVSALRSEHVVRVHDVGRLDGGTPYLVMEMLHGTDLDRRVRKHGPLPIAEAVGYVMQVCEALVEAHALGIIHRDLKPSNLFLVDLPSGLTTVKVLDFGISKVGGLDVPLNEGHGITTTEAVLGSPTFMPPEQLKSAKYVDPRADVWSIGLVLYFLLTGKLAFDAETLGAYLVKILQEPPIPIRSFRPDVPEELAAIIHACIEKEPDRRIQSAADLRAALAPFAPFAAHVSGLYAAARVTGNFAAAPVPSISGLSPSAPTPAGSLAAIPTPAGVFGPSISTPADYALAPPVIGGPPPTASAHSLGSQAIAGAPPPFASTPAGGVPIPSSSGSYPGMSGSGSFPAPPSGGQGAGNSDAPSVPPGLGSPTTQASWTSAGKRPGSGLRWAVIAFAVAVVGLIAAALWPAPVPPPGVAAGPVPSVPPAATTSAPATTAAPPVTATASAAEPTSEPTATAAPPSPSTSTAAKPAAPSGSTTARPRSTGTKHIPGPMETDL